MHLYARHFNDESPTPRGRRSATGRPTYTTPTKPPSSIQQNHKYQSPSLQTSSGKKSLRLLSLVSRFEALDNLSLPDKGSPPKQVPFYLHNNSPIHNIEHSNSFKRTLSTIFSPSTGTLNGHQCELVLHHDDLDGYEDFEPDNVFAPSRPKAIGTSVLRKAARKVQEAQTWHNNYKNRVRNIPGGASYTLFGTERFVVPGASLRTSAPRKRANSIRDIISFFDGAASKGDSTQAVQSPAEPSTPISRTGNGKYSFSNTRGGTNSKCISDQAVDPATPIRSETLSSARKRPWVLGSATPTRLLSRPSLPRSFTSHISPYASNTPRSRASKISSIFMRTPTRSQLKSAEDVSDERSKKGSPSEDRGRRRPRKLEGDDDATSLAKRQLSNKIAELYRVKSLERQRADNLDAANHREPDTKPGNPVPVGNIDIPGNGVLPDPEREPSKVADIKRLFEVRLNKSVTSLVASKGLTRPEFVTLPKPVVHDISPFHDARKSPEPEREARSPPTPPTPPALPLFSHRKPSAVSPKPMPEPESVGPKSPVLELTVVSPRPTLGPDSVDPEPSQPEEHPPLKPNHRFRKLEPLRSQIIQDRIKHFESSKKVEMTPDFLKRRESYARKVRKSLLGIFENATRRNNRDDDSVKRKGLSMQEIERIIDEVRDTAESSCMGAKKNRVVAGKFDLPLPKTSQVAFSGLQERTPSPNAMDSSLASKGKGKLTRRASSIGVGKYNQNVFNEAVSEDRETAETKAETKAKEIAVAFGTKSGRRSKTPLGRWNTFPEVIPTHFGGGNCNTKGYFPDMETSGGERNPDMKEYLTTIQSNGGDGTSSIKGRSPSTDDAAVMVVKEAECGLKQPKPLRVVEMKRMMLLCRERIGGMRDKERNRVVHSRKL